MRIAILAVTLLMAAFPAFPCTTFCLARDGEVLFGRNYDFEIGQGYVMTNRRGVQKASMAGTLSWVSRYGSVTFNQWGREFPMDGMNEAGLVIALMWLEGSEYPRDGRPSLRVLEWIQYQLDNYASVDELIAHAEETRISGGTPLHYLIADATGDAATIEYLGGRLVVHTGASLPTAALTNDRYDSSVEYLGRFSGFGGTRSAPSGTSSLDRFARASMLMRSSEASVDAAMSILERVAQPGGTRWSVVYDARRREISWVSDRNRNRKSIRFSEIDLACSAEAKMIDIHSRLGGDVSDRLDEYSAAVNRQLVVSSYATTSFTRDDDPRWAEDDAAHAESFQCVAARPRRRATR
jgi:penicillin V acylase-like amidase (Ntn superfamily)